MAWWGVALVLGPHINGKMTPDAFPKAYDALQRAQSLAGGASESEQAYIAALARRYGPTYVPDRSALDQDYADAMRALSGRYPADLDAATLAAESLMNLHPWDYWRKDGTAQPWTEEITSKLERVIAAAPRHVGALHLRVRGQRARSQGG